MGLLLPSRGRTGNGERVATKTSPQPHGQQPAPTTRDALVRVITLWLKEWTRNHADSLADAEEEILTAVAAEFHVERLGSLPFVWAGLWRPDHDNSVPVDTLRNRAYARAPVAKAAVERLAKARGVFVELVHIDPPNRVTLRDLMDGTIYRTKFENVEGYRRWMRFATWLVELGDGTWWPPSTIRAHTGPGTLSPDRLLEEFRLGLARVEVEHEERVVDATSPHASFARWAGVLAAAFERVTLELRAASSFPDAAETIDRGTIEQNVPALSGVPRELVQTEEGRAAVEQWLRDAERYAAGGVFLDLDPIREELRMVTVAATLRESSR